MGIDDHEIAKAETLHDTCPQILRIALGVLINKGGVQFTRIDGIGRFRRFQDEGNDQARLADILPKLIAGVRILHPIVHKTHVGNDTQDVVLILVEDAHGLLVGTRQLDLRTATHTQGALVVVQCLLGEHLALLQDELIEVRQCRGVETDRVFHQKDDLHPYALRVVGRIHLILYQLDDGQEQLRVAQPTEHIVDCAQILMGDALRHLL